MRQPSSGIRNRRRATSSFGVSSSFCMSDPPPVAADPVMANRVKTHETQGCSGGSVAALPNGRIAENEEDAVQIDADLSIERPPVGRLAGGDEPPPLAQP